MGSIHGLGKLSSFTLSPDLQRVQLESGYYTNWQLDWKNSTPDAIVTSILLQDHKSQWIQFPRFFLEKECYQSPATFSTGITLLNLAPSQAKFQFVIANSISCQCEVMVPSIHLCIQKYSIENLSTESINLSLEWFIQLKGQHHQSINPWKKNRNTALYLNVEQFHILTTISGPAKVGQHSIPSLSQHACIDAGDTCSFFIITSIADSLAGCEDHLLSFNTHNWDAYFARNELAYHASQTRIISEKNEWNDVLGYSQIQADRLFNASLFALNLNPSLTIPQNEDSIKTDMPISEPTAQVNFELSIFTLYYLWQVHGPKYAVQFQQIMDWVFDHQMVDGQIYWLLPEPNSSLKGNAIPIMARLVWQIYENTRDKEWIEKKYPNLKKFLLSWFTELNDQDQDGCPEWRNPYQAGITEPLLYQQSPIDLHPFLFRLYEHPGLIFFLISDFNSLAKIAEEIGMVDEKNLWLQRANILEQHLQKFRIADTEMYQRIDYFSHKNPPAKTLLNGDGEFDNEVTLILEENNRVRINLTMDGAYTRPVQIKLKGKSDSITLKETIHFTEMIWVENKVTAFSQYTYSAIDKLNISGIKENESWQIEGLYSTYHDIGMLLPQLNNDKKLFSRTGFKQHNQSFGLSILAKVENKSCLSSMPWNAIMIEKLIETNNYYAAANLFSKMLDTATIQVDKKSGLSEYYDSDTALGFGEHNHIHGLIPQALLLKLLGITKISLEEIFITHFNPFSISFTVQYKGMRLILHSDSVEIHFRGFATRITQPGHHYIRLSTNAVE